MSHAVQLQQAADAVLVLINSTPRTPTRAEIAAVIGKALAAPSAARDTYRASAWHRALEDYLVASLTATTDDALDRLEDVTEAICAEPVRTFDDLIVRAAIAWYWCRCELNRDHVFAAVVRGVLELAGLKFDRDGRML